MNDNLITNCLNDITKPTARHNNNNNNDESVYVYQQQRQRNW